MLIHRLRSTLTSLGARSLRNFSVSPLVSQTNVVAAQTSDKKLVALLRRRTGFPIKQCSEALRIHGNNEEAANRWLAEQAEKEGWKKAGKVSGRTTSQGLCSVLVHENFAAFVELACETDFVARNALFQQLLATATRTTLAFRQNVISQNLALSSLGASRVSHERETMLVHKLVKLAAAGSDTEDTAGTLEEQIVAAIGRLGENILIKRAMAVVTPADCSIHSVTHGGVTGDVDGCAFGAYAAAVFLKPTRSAAQAGDQLSLLGRQLSHHVIGMEPQSVHGDDETALLNQEFLMDPSRTVGSLVSDAGVDVVDFVRFASNQ